MKLIFKADDHSYTSDDDPGRKWTSVTTLIHHFKEPFDQLKIAGFCSRKKTSKWFEMEPEKIVEYWNKESERANMLGTWYHDQREKDVSSCETIRREGVDLPIFKPLFENNVKVAPDQALVPGIYPEHFMYLKSAGICGQADRIEIVGDVVNVYDYKTNKKIETEGYTNWEGITKKMLHPLEHLDDCNLIHYTLQLSFYMYMILKHNPNLKPGKLTLQHIIFAVEDEDEFGFPINEVDIAGDPVIKDIVLYEVPYLKNDIATLLNYIKTNPSILDQ